MGGVIIKLIEEINVNKNYIETLYQKLIDIYNKDPFNFLLLCENRIFLKSITEYIIKKNPKSTYTKNMKTLDKFAVDFLTLQNYNKKILSNEFFHLFIPEVFKQINNLPIIKKLKNSPNELNSFIELFKIYRELNRSKTDYIKLNKKYDLYSKELEKNILLRNILEETDNHYTQYLEKNKEYTDMSLILEKLSKECINITNKNIVFITDPESSPKIYEIIENLSQNNQLLQIKNIIKTENIIKNSYYYSVKNEILQTESIVNDIKDKIINKNENPESFCIITQDEKESREIASKLLKINVPYKFTNKFKLKNSKLVKTVIFILDNIFKQYNQDNYIKLIDLLFINQRKISMNDYNKLYKKYRLYNEDQNNWIEKMKTKINELKKVEQTSDEEDYSNDNEIEKLNELIKITSNSLDFINNLRNQKDSLESTFNTISNHLLSLTKESFLELEIEKEALKTTETLIKDIESLYKLIHGTENYNSLKAYNYLKNIIISKNYNIKNINYGCVEITDFINSQFIHNKTKYFSNFSDENYPLMSINSIIKSTSDDLSPHYELKETQEKIKLLYATSLSKENYLITPNETIKGEKKIISTYASEIAQKGQDEMYIRNSYIEYNTKKIFNSEDWENYLLSNNLIEDKENKINKLKSYVNDPIPSFKVLNDYKISQISASKLSLFVDCQFEFFVKNILKIYPEIDETKFFEGNIKHKILEKYYKNNPIKNQIPIQNEDKIKDELSKYFEEEFKNSAPEELKHKIIKDNLKEKILEDLTKAIIEMYNKYFSCLENDLQYEKVLENEFEIIENINNYKAKSIIDRIDLLEDKSLCIIDYKNSDSSFKLEQILFYYNILLKNEKWNEKLNNKTIYLKFQPLKTEKGKLQNNYFLKIEKEKLYLIAKGNKKYTETELNTYFDWFDDMMDEFNDRKNIPISLSDNNIQNFKNHLIKNKDLKIKTDLQKDKSCKGHSFNCDFSEICSNYSYLKNYEEKWG